jgi:hypothetical protein
MNLRLLYLRKLETFFVFNLKRSVNISLSVIEIINFVYFIFFSDEFQLIFRLLISVDVVIFVKIYVFGIGVANWLLIFVFVLLLFSMENAIEA